ncbi:MYND-type zinc finger protein samB [Abortiporus biennis]
MTATYSIRARRNFVLRRIHVRRKNSRINVLARSRLSIMSTSTLTDDLQPELPIIRDNDYSERCSYCFKHVGKANLKKCSRCLMVRYCSKDCQRAAWKSHKDRCKTGGKHQEMMEKDEELRLWDKELTEWLSYWRRTLQSYSLMSMDLPNSPDDKLATHCMVLQLEYRENPPSPALRYSLVHGDVMSRAQFGDLLRTCDATEETVQKWLNDKRGDQEGFKMKQSVDKETSTALVAGWEEGLRYSFHTGYNPVANSSVLALASARQPSMENIENLQYTRDNDFNSRCNFCFKNVGRANLKKCAQCQMVRYCSKECQKSAWKTHKPRCLTGAKNQQQMAQNPEAHKLVTDLEKWLAHWGNTLQVYSILSMDLANSKDDKLATHLMVLQLEYSQNRETPAIRYNLVKGDIMTRSQFASFYKSCGAQENDVQTWLEDNRGDRTVHTAIVVERRNFRFLWWTILEEGFREKKNMDKRTSAQLRKDWVGALTYSFRTGLTPFVLKDEY